MSQFFLLFTMWYDFWSYKSLENISAISNEKSCPTSKPFLLTYIWCQDITVFATYWILIDQFKFQAHRPYARKLWLYCIRKSCGNESLFTFFNTPKKGQAWNLFFNLTIFGTLKSSFSLLSNFRNRFLSGGEFFFSFYCIFIHSLYSWDCPNLEETQRENRRKIVWQRLQRSRSNNLIPIMKSKISEYQGRKVCCNLGPKSYSERARRLVPRLSPFAPFQRQGRQRREILGTRLTIANHTSQLPLQYHSGVPFQDDGAMMAGDLSLTLWCTSSTVRCSPNFSDPGERSWWIRTTLRRHRNRNTAHLLLQT